MHSKILGELTPTSDKKRNYNGRISYNNAPIDFTIQCDDNPFQEALNLAEHILPNLAKYDEIAKAIIAKDLLSGYNSGWTEYDELQADGSYKTITNPTLDADNFKENFTLESVQICGNSCVEIWYNDNNLFWGHRVFVTSMNGANFSEAYAQMIG